MPLAAALAAVPPKEGSAFGSDLALAAGAAALGADAEQCECDNGALFACLLAGGSESPCAFLFVPTAAAADAVGGIAL